MIRCLPGWLIGLLLPAVLLAAPPQAKDQSIRWQSWSEALFQQAEREQKLLLLDLEAVWCHWCHVMDEQTYNNPDVQGLLARHFIAIKVDQDSRPDLANRYKDYGWPATILFNARGDELRKLTGFVPPGEFLTILRSVVAQPVPQEPTEPAAMAYADQGTLAAEVRRQLIDNHYSSYDFDTGGLRLTHRYLEADSTEYALLQASASLSDPASRDARMARLSLDKNLQLFDPVWGGVYQYSTHGDWEHPHYEKIVPTQAHNMRLYALAAMLWGDAKYVQAAREVQRFVKTFLTSPEGAVYVSQDADVTPGEPSAAYFQLGDADRRALGVPAVDTHRYARENGLIIHALTFLYAASGDAAVLQDAIRAAEWVLRHRARPDGGLAHGDQDTAGPYLADTLAMGKAFLGLYTATGHYPWLQHAEACARFITRQFMDYDRQANRPGYFTAATGTVGVVKPVRRVDENIDMARFANLLHHYTGQEAYRHMAEHSMRYLGAPQVALDTIVESGVLLADHELSRPPLHITVVGAKDDPAAQRLHRAAQRQFSTYKRLEWWDRREGALPNPDVTYPELAQAAAFLCTNRRCSLPIFTPAEMTQTLAQFTGHAYGSP